MIYITLKTDCAKASEIKDFLKAEEIKDEKHPYDYFNINYKGVNVHAYKNKKEIFTISFSGKGEEVKELVSVFSKDFTIKETKEASKRQEDSYFDSWEDYGPQIGSDEVGKGDFFGPLIVCAAYVEKKDIDFLEKNKINDSKKMKDDYILQIGPLLKRRIKNYVVMVSPKKLSALYENKFNIDKTLTLCHNLAQKGLKKKYDIPDFVITYVDQFLSEENYRKYLGDDVINNPIYFRTKGETYYPSVACASVIARYTFLKEWEKMEDVFQAVIPKGAGASVDTVYGRLKNIYGEEAIDPYVKRFFSNYKKRNEKHII